METDNLLEHTSCGYSDGLDNVERMLNSRIAKIMYKAQFERKSSRKATQ